MEEALEVDALVIRSEQVVVAPVGGVVQRMVADGEKVRLGAPVVAIGPGTASGTPPATGPAQPAESAPPPASPGTSAAQREYDRLSSQIYQLAVARNQAKYAGEAEKAADLEAQLDSLARQQAALIDQLGRAEPTQQVIPPAPAIPAAPSQVVDPLATVVTADSGGVVIYRTDGLETVLRPDQADSWSLSWLRSLPYPDPKETGTGAVPAGQPVFKIVNEMDLELIVIIPAERLTEAKRTMIQQDGVTLRIPGKERTLTAQVKAMRQEGEELLLHLVGPLPAADSMAVRRIRATLLMETFEGIVVPRSAIDVQNGEQGVWVHEGGQYRFTPVRVVGGNQQEVAVKGELPPDAMLLQAPPPPER